MLIKRIMVQLPGGLQARHTALFVREACSFSKVNIFLSERWKIW